MKWVTVACACLTLASSYPVQNTPGNITTRGDDNGKKIFKRGISSLSSLFGYSGNVGFPNYGHHFTSATSPGLSSYSPFASIGHHHGLHEENHKTTITVTKRVPVPYAVAVEKKVPFKVEVPVDRPYPVYVPKPYPVYIEKKVPYEVKVAVPQPYEVEKKVPVPFEVPYDRPYPVHIEKPYPVIFEKKVHVPVEKHVPVPVKIPVDRPFPIHIPVEKYIPFPIERPVPYPVKIPVEKPYTIPVDEYSSFHSAEKPLSWDSINHFPSRFHQIQHTPENLHGLHWTTDDLRTHGNFFDKSGQAAISEHDDSENHETGLERRRAIISTKPTNDRSDETHNKEKTPPLPHDDDDDDNRDRHRLNVRRFHTRQLELITGTSDKDREKLNATNTGTYQSEKENAINKS